MRCLNLLILIRSKASSLMSSFQKITIKVTQMGSYPRNITMHVDVKVHEVRAQVLASPYGQVVGHLIPHSQPELFIIQISVVLLMCLHLEEITVACVDDRLEADEQIKIVPVNQFIDVLTLKNPLDVR